MALSILIDCVVADDDSKPPPVLEGIGFAEMEHQSRNLGLFANPVIQTISYASFAGGQNVNIFSPDLHQEAGNNQVWFDVQLDPADSVMTSIRGPPLTADDLFVSNPQKGFITYRSPSASEILGTKFEYLPLHMQN